MEKAISVVLTLLLISGCVAPPRQLSKSDAVAEVADSVQPEPLQEIAVTKSDTVTREDYNKLQERFDTYKRDACYYVAGVSFLALILAYFALNAGAEEAELAKLKKERDTLNGQVKTLRDEFLRVDREHKDYEMFYLWLEQYVQPQTWNHYWTAFRHARGMV